MYKIHLKNPLIVGALFSALSFLLFITILIPKFGPLFSIIVPIPIFLYGIKYGKYAPFSIITITFFLINLIFNLSFALTYIIFLGIPGFLLTYFILSDYSLSKIIILSSVLSYLCFILITFDTKNTINIKNKIINFQNNHNTKNLTQNVEIRKELIKKIKLYFKNFYHTFIFANLSFLIFLYYLIFSYIDKYHLKSKKIPELSSFIISWKFSFLFIFSLVTYEILKFNFKINLQNIPENFIGNLYLISLNLLSISIIFYFYEGISVISFFTKKIKVLFKLIFFIMLLLFPPFIFFVIIIGIFDSFKDFRNLLKEDDNNERNFT